MIRSNYKIDKKMFATFLTLALTAIIGLFWVGLHFELFGKKIDFDQRPATFFFFYFPVQGVFSIFYLLFPLKRAINYTAGFVVALYGLYFLGKFVRGEF